MKQGKKLSWKNFPISILLAVSALICIVPFWLVLVSSLTPEADIISYGYSLIPRRIDFTAYKILLADAGRILNGYKISIFVTVVGTVLSVAVITLAAYPISQDRVKYHRALNFFVLFTMLYKRIDQNNGSDRSDTGRHLDSLRRNTPRRLCNRVDIG